MLRQLLLVTLVFTVRGTVVAQCDFPASMTASPNVCLGSTLTVTSPHTLSRIVWYLNSIPLPNVANSTTRQGTLTEAANGIVLPDSLAIPLGFFVDDSGDIFFSASSAAVWKWSPSTNFWINIGHTNALYNSMGCVVDKAGNIYVSSVDASVLKFAPGDTSGVLAAGGNGNGSQANQLNEPIGLALDCAGNLYIVDNRNERVQKWAPGATKGITVAGGNGPGSAANQLWDPACVAVDGAGNVFVTDRSNYRVQKWAPGATEGVTVAGGNGFGSADNQLPSVNTIFVDNDDNLLITDLTVPSRLQRWAAGATTGITLASPQQYPPFAGAFSAFIDCKGNIYSGETLDHHLLMLTQPSTIDNSFQPTTGGRYYAVVTDVNGYTSTTDTIVISPPPPGPPSIQISAAVDNLYLCESDTFTADTVNAGLAPAYQWQVSGVNVGGDSTTWSNNLFANGDRVYCIMTTIGIGCEPLQDTSNIITLAVDPQGHATVTITASDSAACAGTPITLTASVINGSATPAFSWWVNGKSTGIDAPTFTDSTIGNEAVFCEITSDASCGLAKSNTIPIGIYPQPAVPSQVFSVRHGQDLTLDPLIDGDVSDYLWIPGAGLSDSTIRNPIANPPTTTVYTLEVTSPGGCQAKGEITVDVYTPLELPNAFTPNGDGHNDRLYVLGGPAGSIVHVFAVFDRWGTRVFNAQDIAPGDASHGWDGTVADRPAPPGTYVYMVILTQPGGKPQLYKGTVELIR